MTYSAILGSKGSSGGGSTPVESPDSLISTSYANILDGISEGPIVGLVNGAQSIYFDETPLANSDGSLNFTGVIWEQRTGEHDQDYITGFPAVESQTSVGVELKADQPWVQSFSNLELSAVRIQLAVSQLYQTNNDGDMNGYTVAYVIELATDDGDYQTVLSSSFSGKTTTGYQRSHRINLPAADTGWRIRVRRTTADSSSSKIQAVTSVGTYTEVIDAKLQYPYTALVGIKIDASQFSSVPERAFRIRGRIIQVPSNYDPTSRNYSGTWDGTFKLAWTDCPPWIFRDIVLNDRYGLGRFISDSQVDKWSLYQIAQYCDQLVSDGKGGTEPRFTCNVYLQSRNDALTVLQDMASVFRGMSYYAGSEVVCSANMPADPVYTYTNANVIDGKFSRAGSSGSTRYSVAKVAWSDRDNFGAQKVEYVQDQKSVARYGIRETEVTAFGCVSQGQAQRAGKYILLTNRIETQTITFSVGLDGTIVRPGDVIRVADENFAGRSIGGRIKAATTTTVTLDNDVTAASGDTLVVILPTGAAQTRVIRSVVDRVVTVTQAFSAIPVKESVYAIETTDLVTETYRVLTVTESFGDDKLQYDLVAVEHNASKFEAIDNGAQIVTPPTSVLPASVQAPPTDIALSTYDSVKQGMTVATMRITWTAPKGVQSYNVWWRRDSGDWIYAGVTYTAAIEVQGIYTGAYTARVSAVGVNSSSSIWAYSEVTQLYGKTGVPPALASFSTIPEVFGIRLNWAFPEGAEDTFYTEIQESLVNTGDDPVQLSMVSYPTKTYLKSGTAAGLTRFYRARLVDRIGNAGVWTGWLMGQSSSSAGEVLTYLAGQISETELAQHLQEKIEQIDELQAQIDDIQTIAYDSGSAYAAGQMVTHDGRIYQALTAVPESTPPPNATYWLDVGQVVTSANGLAQQVQQNTADITNVAAQAAQVQQLQAAMRPADDGSGEMADALQSYSTIAKAAEETKVRAEADIAQAQRTSLLEASAAENTAKISTIEQAVADSNSATAQRLTSVESAVDNNASKVATLETTVADNQSATAERVENVEAAVGENTAAVQTISKAQSDLEDGVNAMWAIKLQVNANGQYVYAGIGASIENTPGGLQSTLIFTANDIAFANPTTAGALDYPFYIKNGQNFLGSTFIEDGTISNAKIGSFIQSTNYVAATSGWRLDKAGTLEINNSDGTNRTQLTGEYFKVFAGSIDVVTLGKLS